jgi:ethylbenzene dioxygenase subunit beta
MKLHRSEAEDFLFHEADLLDRRRYKEWLDLFTSDGVYWLPMNEEADPEADPSVIYDDMQALKMRLHQLGKRHYAQRPPSRTVHAISNVMTSEGDEADEAFVRCTVMITELREGDHLQLGLGEQRTLVGHCEYRLRQLSGRLAIAMRKLVLIGRNVPIINLSFIP